MDLRTSARSGLARQALAVALALSLGGCAIMPASAPTAGEVASPSGATTDSFVVLDVDRDVVSALGRAQANAFGSQFRAKAPPADLRIAVGDTLQMNVIEQGGPGLFSAGTSTTPTTADRTPGSSILPVTVARDGTVHVPFAGSVRAAGLTVEQVRAAIETKLSETAIKPQVQLALMSGTTAGANSATVGGEIARSGVVALRPVGSRLLDVIAEAGGARFPGYETTVRLTRGGRSAEASLQAIIDNPANNVYVYPRDDIYVTHDPRTFSVLGASSKVGVYPFGAKRVDLAEAVAIGGGFVDGAADPAGVFLFRFEPQPLVRELRPEEASRFGSRVPVIYRLNLRAGDGYFLAQEFELRDKDVLLMANSDGAQLVKFVNLLGSITAIGSNIRTITLSNSSVVTPSTAVPAAAQ